jgi:flavin reductase (DIM6/NTAB) family NADH-FMN oxidoreductase RutF
MSDAFLLLEHNDPLLWIVTACVGDRMGGLVATNVNSASIIPECPRVIAGLAHSHHTWELVEASNAFALHLITENQPDWVWRFGTQSGHHYNKLSGMKWHPGQTGSPLLDEALGWLECRVEARMETGDRTLYLAEVIAAQSTIQAVPLTLKRALELATPEQVREMKRQRMEDAAIDAEAIRRWRERR